MTQRDVFSSPDDRPAYLSSGGEMGERIRVVDWSRTSLGPAAKWPQSLRSAPSISLNSSFFIAIYWGRELRVLYNDEYKGFMDLLAGHIADAVVNARAKEEERRRFEVLTELDRANNAFFSNASHEFRTPLTLMLVPWKNCWPNPGRANIRNYWLWFMAVHFGCKIS